MTEVLGPPAAAAPQVTRPRVDPRFRRRWAEARRAEGRRRLRVLVAALGVSTLVAGAVTALHSPLLRVKDTNVVGNAHTPAAQVLAAAGLAGGKALMIDVGGVQQVQAVESLPWVATVDFARHWPWTVVVVVRERTPVALVDVAGGAELVDGSGRVLGTVAPGERAPTLPQLEGALGAPAGQHVLPGAGMTGGELSDLLAAAASVPRAIGPEGVELAFSPLLGLVANVGPARTLVVLGGASQIGRKFAVLEELARFVELSAYSQVDLTVWQRPALTPLPTSGGA